MQRKILSLLVSIGMLFSMFPMGARAAKDDASDVKVLKDPQEAVKAIHQKKASVRSKASKMTEAQKQEEIERRIVFKNDKVPKDNYGAREIFYYETGGYFIIEYDTAKDAKKAVKKLAKDYPKAVVFQDRMVKLEEVAKSKKIHSKVTTKTKKRGQLRDNPKGPSPTPFDGWDAVGLKKLKEDAKDWKGEVKVAVIDSGINKKHPWFKNRLDTDNSINFAIDFDDEKAYDDPVGAASGGHGTHVSGIIVKGTPNQVKIMAVRVFDIAGSSSIMTITMGVDYAREQNADVLNMSLGHASPTQKEKDWMNASFTKSLAKGAVVCVASGNEYTDTIHSFPASSGQTIAIGSMQPHKDAHGMPDGKYEKSDFSNNGKLLDFVAPGRSIESAHIINAQGFPEDYEYTCIMDGTSMATPFMASEAAMVKLKHPDYNQWDVYAIFRDYAKDIAPEGKDDDTGYGYVDFHDYAKDDENFNGKKRYQSISADTDFIRSMDDVGESIKLNAKITRGDGKLTFTSKDPGRIKIEGDHMVIKGAGNCDIVAKASETDKYKETERHIKVQVTKGEQEIKLEKTKFEKRLGDKPFYLKGKITKGDGKMSFVSNENNVIDVEPDGKVTIKGKGTTSVFALASNTKNYNRYTSGAIKITVSDKKVVPKIIVKTALPGNIKRFNIRALKNKRVQLKWKKVKGANGYQIAYSLKKSRFKKLKTVGNIGKTVIRSKKLRKAKRYYFVIRAYKKVNGKIVYGKYSAIKKVKIRK